MLGKQLLVGVMLIGELGLADWSARPAHGAPVAISLAGGPPESAAGRLVAEEEARGSQPHRETQ
jgi:hypothetical protein